MKCKIWLGMASVVGVLFAGTYYHLATAHPLVLAYGIGNWILESQNEHLRWCCGPSDCEKIERTDVRVNPSGWSFTNPHNDRTETIELDQQYHSPNEEYWACFNHAKMLRCGNKSVSQYPKGPTVIKKQCCFWAPQPGV